MATEIKMPKLGMTMEEGKLLEWARKEKNLVKKGEVLLTIESDKVTFEVESPGDGLLLILVAGGGARRGAGGAPGGGGPAGFAPGGPGGGGGRVSGHPRRTRSGPPEGGRPFH